MLSITRTLVLAARRKGNELVDLRSELALAERIEARDLPLLEPA